MSTAKIAAIAIQSENVTTVLTVDGDFFTGLREVATASRATKRTAAQSERQAAEHRSPTGTYAVTNPCEGCGKSAGVNYYSDSRCDLLGGRGLVLCWRCARKGEAMPAAEALAFYTARGVAGTVAK